MKNTDQRKSVAIIDYGMGNIDSVDKMVRLLNFEPYFATDNEQLNGSSFIILPGVGSYSKAYNNLKAQGLIEGLRKHVIEDRKPFLGICLGMQLLSEEGEEGGKSKGLGWIKGKTKIMERKEGFNIPHMGWSRINLIDKNNLFKDFSGNSPEFYFAHSYALEVADPKVIIADFFHGETYVAAIKKDNIYGTQFHPEKSQEYGKVLLENFLQN